MATDNNMMVESVAECPVCFVQKGFVDMWMLESDLCELKRR